MTFRRPVLQSSVDVENIALHNVCVCARNTSYSFIVDFVRKSWEARTSNRLAFNLSFWKLLFIQQQQGQIAFALLSLSHLFVSPERSFFDTYQVHLMLEMSRDKLLTDRNLIPCVSACCKLNRIKANYITFGGLSMLSGCYNNELQNSRRLNLWVRFLIQLCKNAIIIKQRPHTWSTVWKTIWNMWKWCVVNLFWYQTISKNQVHYPGLMQWCVCSSIMFILFLQRQVAKLASVLFRRWSLLRNNKMVTNLQRFTSNNGRRRFTACDSLTQ